MSNPAYYDKAVEAYSKIAAFPNASVGTQRKAMVGLGVVAEARAQGKAGQEYKNLIDEALKNYLGAFTFRDLQEGDADDLFWFQKSGMESARIAETRGEWSRAINIYNQLQALSNLSPQFQATLKRRLDKARENVIAARN
jgi:hypothetical protein